MPSSSDNPIPFIQFIREYITNGNSDGRLQKQTRDGFEYNGFFTVTYEWIKELSKELSKRHLQNEAPNNVSPLT